MWRCCHRIVQQAPNQHPRTKVVFNAPIEIELVAPVPVSRGSTMTHPDIQAYIYAAMERGFDENAIVVRRSETSYMRRDVVNWGIIKRAWRYKTGNDYTPFDVLWFNNSKATGHWAEELYIVHAHQSMKMLDDIFKAQEEEDLKNEPA